MLNIHGFGDNLTINNIRIGDLSPAEHEKIDLDKGGRNYRPLENVVVSHVKDSSTLICRKPSENGVKSYIEEELIDGLCCYSAVNHGQLNQTIVDAVVKHLMEEKLPTLKRSIKTFHQINAKWSKRFAPLRLPTENSTKNAEHGCCRSAGSQGHRSGLPARTCRR